MNNLSRGVKLLLGIMTGLVGFVIITVIWIDWQQSMGLKIPGIIFIWFIFKVIGAINGIWQNQPEREDKPGKNLSRETNEQKFEKQ